MPLKYISFKKCSTHINIKNISQKPHMLQQMVLYPCIQAVLNGVTGLIEGKEYVQLGKKEWW